MPRLILRAVAVVAAVTLAGGCSSGKDPKAQPTPSLPVVTLPPGDLREKVLQPLEVTTNMVPIAAQTGTRDAAGIAAFSADPKAAQQTLVKNGFQSAYVVQYADPAANTVITNVATKFATAEGATADLTADLTSSAKTGTAFAADGLGEQAGGISGKRDDKSPDGSLVTLRWRSGDTTWLLAVSASTPVAQDGVRKLADKLMTRLASGA